MFSKADVHQCFTKKLFLRILTGKKLCEIKLQLLQKVQIWVFGLLVQQINSLKEVLTETKFSKNEVVTGKTPLFLIDPFCSHNVICFNISFWHGSFEWKRCVFNLSAFNQKTVLQFSENGFRFPENLFQS